VAHARERAGERYAGTPWRTNGQIPPVELLRGWPLPGAVVEKAAQALDDGRLTARGFGRVIRTAWTLSDLQDLARPGPAQVDHALEFRGVPARREWVAA
jgi:magnesium chelatase family protein